MPSLPSGTYRIVSRVSQSSGNHELFVGIDTKQRHEQRSGPIKEGTPIILVPKQKIVKIELQHIGGDNYRMSFIAHEASGLNLGCDKHNLQKNNKVFVTKEEVEWAIDQGNHENCYHVQVRESGMYWTVPENAKEHTQLKLEQLQGKEGQEWEFERIEKEN
ncbi:hypothetical protein RSOL_383060 [Rhizoctonia solani AG-3 Rhs1AP]|uniref:Ricin B lectin domain-containing protein n=1 Tax=Rhizoctonia solani AG-3 Rhs1AP TaxID=1086054 RepID=X8JCT5_9AGAM|nr:hypothetical protein RSOL_383060 [Rhizoctonia solani AG-3 Rhs1AP]